jgi:hypothetical protein
MFTPVSFGGNIISGDVGNGPTQIGGSSHAEGGQFDFKLDMPMPLPVMQLQNLGIIDSVELQDLGLKKNLVQKLQKTSTITK